MSGRTRGRPRHLELRGRGAVTERVVEVFPAVLVETHDVEPVEHDRHTLEQVVLDDRSAIALVRIDRGDLDPLDPAGGLRIKLGAEIGGVATVEHIDDLTGIHVDRRAHEPSPAVSFRW